MKYIVFFVLACVALAAAAPQLLTYPGYVGTVPYGPLATRTLVTGPTVVNGALTGWPGRFYTPALYGPSYL